jgi:hypothetical protein
LIAGYAADPWFQNTANTATLQQENGIWIKDNATVVPNVPSLKESIIAELHSSIYAGHFGINKTTASVQRLFWWPKLPADVAHYVQH